MQPSNTELAKALPQGTTIDAYRITGVLGIGGFGITYTATDTQLEREVAVKEYCPLGVAMRHKGSNDLIPYSKADMESYEWGLTRFLDEARTLAKFHSQYIVQVQRYLQANNTAYLVMNYEKGRTLAHVLEHRLLPETSVRKLLGAMLLGLKTIHSQSYLHRDIKPSNIFLRRKGAPLLIDFGSARQAFQQRAAQMTTIVTPRYTPLEQYGSGTEQGPWTDLYALGATAFQCLTGSPPRDAAMRAASDEEDIIEGQLLTPRPRCSKKLAGVISWMLQPLPKYRPQSCAEVLSALGLRQKPAQTEATGPHDTTCLTQPAPLEPRSRLDRAHISLAESLLAEHLGPITVVLAKKAAKSAFDRDDFINRLAAELDDPEERTRFVTQFDLAAEQES